MALRFIYVFIIVHRIARKIKKGLATNFIISNRENQIQKRVMVTIFRFPT